MERKLAKALYDFVAEDTKELSFCANEVLAFDNGDDREWVFGTRKDGNQGWFPRCWVKEIETFEQFLEIIESKKERIYELETQKMEILKSKNINQDFPTAKFMKNISSKIIRGNGIICNLTVYTSNSNLPSAQTTPESNCLQFRENEQIHLTFKRLQYSEDPIKCTNGWYLGYSTDANPTCTDLSWIFSTNFVITTSKKLSPFPHPTINETNYYIKKCEISDFAEISTLDNIAFGDENAFTSNMLLNFYNNFGEYLIGIYASKENKLVGCAMLSIEKVMNLFRSGIWSHIGHLISVAILPEHRGKGLAKMLMSELIKRVESSDISEIYLEVRQSNAAAIVLYESFGFEKVAEKKKYYVDGEDGWCMRKGIAGRDLPKVHVTLDKIMIADTPNTKV